MKLWVKLALTTVLVLLAATLSTGAAMLYQTLLYNQEKTMESGHQQLASTAYALARELENGPLTGYSEATKNSYVNYTMKKFGASKYILIEDGEVLCNMTPFDLADSRDERWQQQEGSAVIQKSGEQYILIEGQKVPTSGGSSYALVLVQDISALYQDMKRQMVFGLWILADAAAIAMLLIFLMTRRILKPLRELQKAAMDISEGMLTRRARVRTKDEIGVVADAFNRMADKIESQVTELSQVSEQRRQMLGSLTHELKTPMTSIIGYSDTLLHVNVRKEQQQRALWHIKEECSRLERLSSKLMNLMGLYENDSVSMEEISMEELFAHVAQMEKYHLEQMGMRLDYRCSMGKIRMDRDLMESLLINLIDNGAKASKAGDEIFLEGQGNRITVRDKGCGIPEDEIGRVTEAFYMVDKARSRKAGGCGLGLALCVMIARLHGAELEIHSKVGEGTKVCVVFPEIREESIS